MVCRLHLPLLRGPAPRPSGRSRPAGRLEMPPTCDAGHALLLLIWNRLLRPVRLGNSCFFWLPVRVHISARSAESPHQ